MALPSVVGTWTHSPNNRITFVSLNDTTAAQLIGIKAFLVGTMAFTLKYSCDGTTGPSSSSDHTDRISSKANCATRGASTSAACSFFVVTDGNGVDWSFSYIGSTDDVYRVAYSTTGVYLPAGTATFQPIATDEVVLATGITMVNATASGDRVFHMQATTDRKNFRIWTFRAGTCIRSMYFENVTSVVSAMPFSPPFTAWQNDSVNLTNYINAGYPMGIISSSTVGATNSASARINGTTVGLGGSGECFLGQMTTLSGSFTVAAPELQGACPLVPLGVCTSTSTRQGKIGNRPDAWTTWANTIAAGDTWGSKQFVLLNGIIVPADGVTTMVYT